VPDQGRVNDPLFNGPADWISPGFDDQIFAGRWYTDPPATEGRKVVITDTDHYAPGNGDAMWAWKSFLRGHNPILMDFGIIDVVNPLDPSLGVPSYESFEPARSAMGDTRRFAELMRLVEMEPRGDLSSTGYVLANPGREYLVLEPGETAASFTVTLVPGTYTVQWYGVNGRETVGSGEMTVDAATKTTFTAPFQAEGPAVLYLKTAGR
jgi:hypothetical protein